MTTPAPVCIDCKHFDKDRWNCPAFPDGIPEPILVGDNDHSKPLPDQQNEIIFEPIDEK